MTRPHADAGFSLIEVLVATAIMLTITGAIFTVMNPSSTMFQTQPEVVDMQQRLRIGVDTLTKDLMMAGAGAYSGAQSGSLAGFFAPIHPNRQGNLPQYDDPAGTFKSDAITIFYVPTTSSQTSLSQEMTGVSADLTVNPETNCPQGQSLCGFAVGMGVLIYDDTGAYDTMVITEVQDQTAHLQHRQHGDLSKTYDPGAKVVQYEDHVYYLDTTTRQLMHYDGYQTIAPVLDQVVGLNFEYYGDPAPPAMVDGNGLSGQSVTYGPKPPAIGEVRGDWPAGENCAIQVMGGIQQPRLANLAAGGPGLVLLTSAQLTDGPWCPGAANSNRFDADLYRVRKVRVTLRLQTGNPFLRSAVAGGPDALFTVPGTGSGSRLVGDQQIRFDVSPRNLNLSR